jgi:hypothetical protein
MKVSKIVLHATVNLASADCQRSAINGSAELLSGDILAELPEEWLDKMTMPAIAVCPSRSSQKEITYANHPTYGYVHRE